MIGSSVAVPFRKVINGILTHMSKNKDNSVRNKRWYVVAVERTN